MTDQTVRSASPRAEGGGAPPTHSGTRAAPPGPAAAPSESAGEPGAAGSYEDGGRAGALRAHSGAGRTAAPRPAPFLLRRWPHVALAFLFAWALLLMADRYDDAVQALRETEKRQAREELSQASRRRYMEEVGRAVSALDDEPGLAVARVRPVRGGDFEITVLKDPMAPDPEAVLDRGEIGVRRRADRGGFRLAVKPYMSADPSLVLRRAERILGLPPGARLDFEPGGGLLTLSGEAPLGRIQEALRAAPLVPGVLEVAACGLRDPREARALELLGLTDGLTVSFPPGGAEPLDPACVLAAAAGLADLAELALAMEVPLTVRVVGRPDGDPGAPAGPAASLAGTDLARARAAALAGTLSGTAPGAAYLAFGSSGGLTGSGTADAFPDGAAGTASVNVRLGDGGGLHAPPSGDRRAPECPGAASPAAGEGAGRAGR